MNQTPSSTNIFIKLYQKDGQTTGHGISLTGNFDQTAGEKPVAKDDAVNKSDEAFASSIENFVESMPTYLDFIPVALSIAPTFSSAALMMSIDNFLQSKSVDQKTVDDGIIFELPRNLFGDFSKLTQHIGPSFDFQATLSKNALMGLVSVLDHLISNLMHIAFVQNPSLVDADAGSILIKDVLSFTDFEEFRQSVIRTEIDKICWSGLDAQVKWIEKKFNIDAIVKNYKNWPVLNEIYQRRNLFAHSNGIVSSQYLKNGKSAGYDTDGIDLGIKLGVTKVYYRNSVHCIFEFGIMLSHILRKKLCGKVNSAADQYLNELGFKLLQRGEYQLALKVLEFASSLRDVADDLVKKMYAVNYANALKLCKKDKDSEKVLNEQDWSASKVEFEACVAAVRGDVDAVVGFMKKIGPNGPLSEASYREWPVFFHVRDDKKFIETYVKVFGIPYRASSARRDAMTEIRQNLKKEVKSELVEVKKLPKARRKSKSLN